MANKSMENKILTNKKIPSDLMTILIWTIATFTFVITPTLEHNIMRTVLGIPFVLFIPGYVLISTLFPKKDDLDTIERIALSFGLSIAVVPLLGLVLNFTFGIRLIPILVTLTLYTIVLTIIAIYRRDELTENERFSVSFYKIYKDIISSLNIGSGTDKILTGVLILTILIAIGMIFFVITTPKIGEKFTEFYILNSTSGKADNYQTNLKIDYPVTYLIGVVNHEYTTVNYTIYAKINQDILESQEIMLNHDERWEDNITLVPNKEGSDIKLEFLLFKEDNLTAPYRELHLWINSTR